MVTEIIELKVKEKISPEKFLEVLEKVELDFHMKQKGFVGTELAKGEESDWVMIQHYETMDDIKLVGAKIPTSDVMKEFSKVVVEGSVKIKFLKRVKTWRR